MSVTTALDLIAEAVESELQAQERRGDALDSKAGLVLGFGGVLVGLGAANGQGLVGRLAFASAASSATVAMATFSPRPFLTIDPLKLRMAYVTATPAVAKRRLMDTRIVLYQQADNVLRRKALLLRLAVGALTVSIVLTSVGAILR